MKLIKNVVETDVNLLHRKSEPVDISDKKECAMLKETLVKAFTDLHGACQGLAAIQLGIPKRAILLRFKKGATPIVIFNPTVRLKFGSEKSVEGCMSEPGHRYEVHRPILLFVNYYTAEGEKDGMWLGYREARILMHEYDHLDGVLLQDKGKVVD